MKKAEDISKELENNDWPHSSTHPFIDEVLFKTVFEQIKDDEVVVSQLWGVRLNEQGELTTQYELLTLTENHLISVYSDLENENDKVHVFSQPLKEISCFATKVSKLHKGYVTIHIILNGVDWSLESNDFKTADHFNQQVDRLLLAYRHDKDDEVVTNFNNKDDSNLSLKTVHTKPKMKPNKAKQWNKKNLKAIKKYATNNILWYSLVILSSLVNIAIASAFVGSVSLDAATGALTLTRYTTNRASFITAGTFALIFAIIQLVSFIMLTIKIWDKHHFSRQLHHAMIQFILAIMALIFAIILIARTDWSVLISAIYLLPISLFFCFNSTYLLINTCVDLKQAKAGI